MVVNYNHWEKIEPIVNGYSHYTREEVLEGIKGFLGEELKPFLEEIVDYIPDFRRSVFKPYQFLNELSYCVIIDTPLSNKLNEIFKRILYK